MHPIVRINWYKTKLEDVAEERTTIKRASLERKE